MAVRFPDSPHFTGFNKPARMEGDILDVEVVQGEVPPELDGTYYRVAADRQWAPLTEGDFPFNWDGMVSMFRFSRGHVDFRCRYVRTPRFLAEREVRGALFGAYRNPFTDDPSVAGLSRGLANTNVFWHAGRLLASKEDSAPIELDPDTLETIGEYNFGGQLTSQTATAHPKVDPETGEMVFFGYAARGETTPDIAYYEADPNGKITHEAWIVAPYSSMIHDWAVTKNFVIFPIIPMTSDLERLKQGGSHFAWDGSKDVYLGVLPRKGTPDQVRWYRGTNRFASHIMNAYDDGRRIYIDTPVGETSAFPFFPDVSGAPFDPVKALGRLSRWTIDTANGNGFTETRLTDVAGEFPRVDDRWETRSYGYGFMAVTDVPGEPRPGAGFRWVGAIDLATNTMLTHYVGDGCSVGEPIFVPVHEDAGHTEGYVLAVVGRQERMHSDLLILDPQKLDGEPVATLTLPIRLGFGLHGNWVTAAELAERAH